MRPHAEIAEVWPRDGHIRLLGRIHGVPAGGTWRLVLTRRAHTGRTLRYDTAVEGDRFETGLPVGDLAAADYASVEEWDVHLSDGEVELRAGRHLDDVRGKKRIFVYPEQRVGDLGVRPYYTIKDNLSLECRTKGSA
ncbi:hypothetical protein PV379_33960 [Streptomyces caniscabiei]|uniref:hypothetical protein n=1 Tax=Streptomyces caniscabiei TaxID=2746961 RepID=UPI0029B470B9|nr:hypothetical protein [Streptomyces caniscabiei]MDX2599590.1 hypothetical protein [Streptomyces caniscabiei]MDX2735115.1 hypothetical protein [Streptomyces caniscabiei]MDX2782267.1 hypothetical protein [Streptomyces caniscabiei]